eukprot:jgi/Chlat1/1623/Chrsp127S01886
MAVAAVGTVGGLVRRAGRVGERGVERAGCGGGAASGVAGKRWVQRCGQQQRRSGGGCLLKVSASSSPSSSVGLTSVASASPQLTHGAPASSVTAIPASTAARIQKIQRWVQGVQHVGVTVKDIEVAKKFWIDVLGGNMVTDELNISGDGFHGTLFRKELDDLKRLNLKPPGLCVPDMGGSEPTHFLDVFFIQFDVCVVELIWYHDKDGKTFDPGWRTPFTAPAVWGSEHIDFEVDGSVNLDDFRARLIQRCKDVGFDIQASPTFYISGGHFEGWNLFYAKGPDGEQLEFNQVTGHSHKLFSDARSLRGQVWGQRQKVG